MEASLNLFLHLAAAVAALFLLALVLVVITELPSPLFRCWTRQPKQQQSWTTRPTLVNTSWPRPMLRCSRCLHQQPPASTDGTPNCTPPAATVRESKTRTEPGKRSDNPVLAWLRQVPPEVPWSVQQALLCWEARSRSIPNEHASLVSWLDEQPCKCSACSALSGRPTATNKP